MRTALTLLLAVHGAVHLIGFVKWSKIASVPQLSGQTLLPLVGVARQTFGSLWLVAFAALLAAAVFRVGRHGVWWIPALVGVVLSQALVVVAWHDAKFGTPGNLLILAAAIMAAGHARFEGQVEAEARSLLAKPFATGSPIVHLDELQQLPPPVRRWLVRSGAVGRERARTVRLKQRGNLRTEPDAAWMPAEADQYFSIEEPAFVWKVDTTMRGFLPVVGRDKYAAGSGHMLIKVASFLKVVDQADQKIAEGALLRFLGEIVWFPSAALSSHIEWTPVDDMTAEARIRHAGLTASAVFAFDDRGRVLGLRAERYLGGGPDATLEPWFVACSEWRKIRGVEIPAGGSASWKLGDDYFTYYRWEILDVEYNPASLYDELPPAPSESDGAPAIVESHSAGS
jgi:hypothetical protein